MLDKKASKKEEAGKGGWEKYQEKRADVKREKKRQSKEQIVEKKKQGRMTEAEIAADEKSKF